MSVGVDDGSCSTSVSYSVPRGPKIHPPSWDSGRPRASTSDRWAVGGRVDAKAVHTLAGPARTNETWDEVVCWSSAARRSSIEEAHAEPGDRRGRAQRHDHELVEMTIDDGEG